MLVRYATTPILPGQPLTCQDMSPLVAVPDAARAYQEYPEGR